MTCPLTEMEYTVCAYTVCNYQVIICVAYHHHHEQDDYLFCSAGIQIVSLACPPAALLFGVEVKTSLL